MAISAKASKMLWGRAAALCSMADCRRPLVVDETDANGAVLIGEMCHIVADSEDGPRGNSPLTQEERDAYDNLLLLCRNHHREVDGQPDTFTVDRLKTIKTQHERWIHENLPGYDAVAQREDEIYAGYVDDWTRRSDLPGWRRWSSWVLEGDQPQLSVENDDRLRDLGPWLLTRIWPGRYPHLEKAFTNFRLVLQDFRNTFHEHAEISANQKSWHTIRFYKLIWHAEDEYRRLLREYSGHVELVCDLMFELTRAANLVCDEVRASIVPGFWLDHGRLAVESGPHLPDLSYYTHVPQYSSEERAEPMPYPGLEAFKEIRNSRDA